MPPKAYRWVGEMEEIAETFHSEAGFDKTIYLGTAEVFRAINEDTELGRERTGMRSRGQTIEDVTSLLLEGMKTRRLRKDSLVQGQAPQASKSAADAALEGGVIGLNQ